MIFPSEKSVLNLWKRKHNHSLWQQTGKEDSQFSPFYPKHVKSQPDNLDIKKYNWSYSLRLFNKKYVELHWKARQIKHTTTLLYIYALKKAKNTIKYTGFFSLSVRESESFTESS